MKTSQAHKQFITKPMVGVALAAATNLLMSAPLLAGQPTPEHFQGESTFQLPCGVTVLAQTDAYYLTQKSSPNTLWKEINIDFEITYTNVETGQSVVLKRSGVETATSAEIV